MKPFETESESQGKKGTAATSERKQGPYLTYKLNGNI